VKKQDFTNKLCSKIDTQKIKLTLTNSGNISDSQIQSLVSSLSKYANIIPSRINITTQSSNQPNSTDLIVSISNGDLITHSSVIYNLTNSQPFASLLDDAKINTENLEVNTLTFNETVGTDTGCYTRNTGESTLIFGVTSCDITAITSNGIITGSSDTIQTTYFIIVIVIAVIAGLGLIITILIMTVKPIRRKVFPYEEKTKTRMKMKKDSDLYNANEKLNDSNTSLNSSQQNGQVKE